MTTIEAFGQFRPFSVGFDSIFEKLSEASIPHSNNYPPYNIVKRGDNQWFIELAVAGFSKKDIDIELKENNLTVTCSKDKNDNDVKNETDEFVHKGISERNFYKTFALAEHVEVKGAEIVDGILSIELMRNIPEEKKPRLIPIGQ